MVDAKIQLENHKPSLSISGGTVFKPGDTCVLSITKTDADSTQILTTAVKDKPEGSLLKDGKFTWIIPAGFTGRDTVVFIVTDNGFPQESDTETVVITVTSTPNAPLITISGDTVVKPLETCKLTIHTSDKDLGQILHVTMTGQPAGAALVNDSQFTWTVPNVTSAKHIVTFTVTDNGVPPLSASASVTIQVATDTGSQKLAYTVTYIGNGNTSGVAPVDSNKYLSGAIVTVAKADSLLKTGCTFAGWNTAADCSGTAYAAAATFTMLSANVTLYAQWKIKQYSVTYDANGASAGSVPADANLHDSASSVPVMANTGSLVKTGYSFDGWNTTADGKGTTYTAGTGTFTITATSILYAKWKIKTFTLRYNGNGNTGGDVPDDAVYDSNTTVTVSGNTNTLTKTGFDFSGWNTKADGSGVILPAASTLKIKSDTTLFAQWIVKKYNLTIETPVNGTTNLSGCVSVDSATAKSIIATPLAGYKFKCWRVISGSAKITDTASANTTVTLTLGNATIKVVFTCITFVKQVQMAQYSGLSIRDIIQADDGSYMLAGMLPNDGKGIVIKLDLNGDTVWTRTFPITSISSVNKIPGGCSITGTLNSKIDVSFYQLNGNQQLWYPSQSYNYYGSTTRLTSDNGYIIGGYNNLNASFLVKTDAGRTRDEWSFEYTGCIILNDCVQTSDDGYMLVGTTARGATSCIIKVNSQGLEKWRDDFDSTIHGQGISIANSIENTKDGGCVIGGVLRGSSINYEGYLLKVSQAGQVKLYKTYPNTGGIASVKPIDDGYFIAGSTTVIGPGMSDFYLAKVNSSGAIIKETAYGTSDADEGCTGMNLTSDGGCIMTGGNWVIKTDENGEVK